MTTEAHALHTALTGDATLIAMATGTRIYDTMAPPGATFPYIIFQRQNSGPERICQRTTLESTWVVKVVTQGYGIATAESIMARVDTVLDGQTLTVTGYSTYYLQRVQPDIDYIETATGGQAYSHFGHSYLHRMSAD